MARGGKREGAGRKAGSANNRSKKLEATIASILKDAEAQGPLMPLDFMLSLMRDEDQPKAVRMLMAEKAAPYVHAKLSSVDMASGKAAQAVHEEALKALR